MKYDPINGKFKFSNGWDARGELDYVVIKENGRYILIFGEEHSFLANWRNIEYGGRIEFTRKGKLKYINNDSGHYKPLWTDEEGKKLVIKLFKERFGIDISDKFIKYNEK